MRRSSCSAVSAVLLLVASLTFPASGYAAPVGVACGDTIGAGATVVLAGDLYCPGGTGLHLMRGSVLDLGGHSLIGPGASVSGSVGLDTPELFDSSGLPAPNDGQTVRNGTIRDWAVGIAAGYREDSEWAGRMNEIAAVVFRDNGTGLEAEFYAGPSRVVSSRFEGNDTGWWNGRADSTVLDSSFVHNRTTGLYTGYASSVSVVQSTFVGNGYGVSGGYGGRVTLTRDAVAGNQTGVEAGWCDVRIRSTSFRDNGRAYHGIYQYEVAVDGNTFAGNHVAVDATNGNFQRNVFRRNGVGFTSSDYEVAGLVGPPAVLRGNRFVHNGDGIYSLAPVQLGGNTARGNARYGIYAPYAIDLGRNRASGNGAEPQCTGVVCRR